MFYISNDLYENILIQTQDVWIHYDMVNAILAILGIEVLDSDVV